MTRGLRNCNPGNIRHSSDRFRGEIRPSADRSFKQFGSMAWGYRAIFVVIATYIRRHGLKSVEQIIRRWAPPSENDTESYIRAVCRHSGLARQHTIDPRCEEEMVPLAGAISRVENGLPPSEDDVKAGWRCYIEDRN